MSVSNVDSLSYILPELVLAATILAVFVADLLVRTKTRIGEIALVGTAISLLATTQLVGTSSGWLFGRMVVNDPFALFFKILFALAALAAVWMSIGSKEIAKTSQGEYYGLVLSSTLGMYFMASASNLVMAYLSLEFVNLTSYVLSGYLRQ